MSIASPQPNRGAHSLISDRGAQDALHDVPGIIKIRDRRDGGRKVTSANVCVALWLHSTPQLRRSDRRCLHYIQVRLVDLRSG